MRFLIELSFNGTLYHGWQIQPHEKTIQGQINSALSFLLKENIQTVGAGRTDSGVHAEQMFAHFDYDHQIDLKILKQKMNSFLDKDILIKKIKKVSKDFHARFDAVSRTYEYRISRIKNPFNQDMYFLYKDLNLVLMNEAANQLIGKKDFTSFSKLHTQTHTNICTIETAKWIRKKNQLVFKIVSDRFLRNMVRSIVGTMINVGQGKLIPNEIHNILNKKDRSEAGFSAPAKGLFLTSVLYKRK